MEISNLLSSDEKYLSVLAEVSLLPDELVSIPVKLASLSQIRQMFGQSRYISIHTINEIFTTLFNVICIASVQSVLLASIDTFATVLVRSSQPPYDILLAICVSTNSICKTVLASRSIGPTLMFNIERHVNDPELSLRILQLIESILGKLSVHRLTSEKGLGNSLDSFTCYMVAVTNHILSHCKDLPAFYSLMTRSLSAFTLLISGSRTVPQTTIYPLVAEILALISSMLNDHQRTIQATPSAVHTHSSEGTAYALLTASWRCLSHIFSVYQISADDTIDLVRALACKSIATDLSSLIAHVETTDICDIMSVHFLNLLPKDAGGLFEAYIASPLSILQTMLNYGSMQTNDSVAKSFFCDQTMSAIISRLIIYGCCIDRHDLHEWMTSPFNGSLLDISGGKTNECCDFIAECFFGFQSLLIKDFMSAFTAAITSFSSLTEESSEYLTVSLTLDSILAIFGTIWPNLIIDIECHGTDGHGDKSVDKECGALFLFEDAYSIFDSLFRVCSAVLKRPLYGPATVRQPAALGNLIFLRRLLLLISYISASILPEFVDSCFSLLLCFLQGPMLVKQLPGEEQSIETYMGLQVIAANAISTIVADISSADQQREALLSSNHTLNILFAEIDILNAVFSDASRLPSDGYIDIHTTLVEGLLSFVNHEQDNMKLERSFFSSLACSLGSLVVRASEFSNRSSALHRLLKCYREALLIIIYSINLEQHAGHTDLSIVPELFKLMYSVYMGTILPLIDSVLIDSVLEIVRAVLSFLDLCSSLDDSKECLEATALVLFQLASTTSQSGCSREAVYTHTMVTSLIVNMIQLYPKYMVTEGNMVTSSFLSYLFGFTDSHADINDFYQTFAVLIESLADSGELARVLYKDVQLMGALPRIHQFIEQYAYLPPNTPLIDAKSLMAMDLPVSAILIYLSFRCACTSITADSHRSILLRAYCYAAPLIYATDTCLVVLGTTDAFLTRLSDFIYNLLPCLSDALFNKRIATILQVFIALDGYDGPAPDVHVILANCVPQLSEAIQQFKEFNRDEVDPTYTAIVRALESLIDRRTAK